MKSEIKEYRELALKHRALALKLYERKAKPMKSKIKEYRELSLHIDHTTVKGEWLGEDFVRRAEDYDLVVGEDGEETPPKMGLRKGYYASVPA